MYHYVRSYNERDAVMVSMGKGTSCYCDPMIIPELTGEPEVDKALKANAISSTTKMLGVIVKGNAKEVFNEWESGVISEAIKDVYDMYQVTEEPETCMIQSVIMYRRENSWMKLLRTQSIGLQWK